MLAEDLLMLLHHAETGRLLVWSDKADLALGGALLVELAERQRIELTGPHRVTKNRTVAVIDPTSTGDGILDEALRRISARRSTRAQVVVSKIAKGARSRLLDRLTEQGRFEPKQARLVGIVPAGGWPAADAQHTAELKRGLQHVLVGERSPTHHEAATISLLHAVGGTTKALGDEGHDRREVKQRARAIAEGNAAGEIVRQALDAAAF